MPPLPPSAGAVALPASALRLDESMRRLAAAAPRRANPPADRYELQACDADAVAIDPIPWAVFDRVGDAGSLPASVAAAVTEVRPDPAVVRVVWVTSKGGKIRRKQEGQFYAIVRRRVYALPQITARTLVSDEDQVRENLARAFDMPPQWPLAWSKAHSPVFLLKLIAPPVVEARLQRRALCDCLRRAVEALPAREPLLVAWIDALEAFEAGAEARRRLGAESSAMVARSMEAMASIGDPSNARYRRADAYEPTGALIEGVLNADSDGLRRAARAAGWLRVLALPRFPDRATDPADVIGDAADAAEREMADLVRLRVPFGEVLMGLMATARPLSP